MRPVLRFETTTPKKPFGVIVPEGFQGTVHSYYPLNISILLFWTPRIPYYPLWEVLPSPVKAQQTAAMNSGRDRPFKFVKFFWFIVVQYFWDIQLDTLKEVL